MAITLVGTRIRQRRKLNGLKQSDLARQSGISASYLNLIEHNRRGIAGKVLLDIAAALNVPVAQLTDGAQTALIQDLQKVAAHSDPTPEVTQIEDLIGRFPSWAQKLASQNTEITRIQTTVDRLSDRLTHDPFLSESLHEVLSNVTAIRSVSSILAKTTDILPAQQSRFHNNLLEESQRLAETSQALVAYFDQMSQPEARPSTPFEEFDAYLKQNEYAFEWLADLPTTDINARLAESDILTGDTSRHLALGFLAGMQSSITKLALATFTQAAQDHDFAPDILAAIFDCSLADVFRRLAFLPISEDGPKFGLISCDISGAIILRKSLPGFSLPRYGTACPLWPLYQAITQPNTPIKSLLETPDKDQFVSFALCHEIGPHNFNAPTLWQATMIFKERPLQIKKSPHTWMEKPAPIGFSCKICPRTNCLGRREPSIYEDAS